MPSAIKHSYLLLRQIGLKDFGGHLQAKIFDRLHSGKAFKFILIELTNSQPLSSQTSNSITSADHFHFASFDELLELSKDPMNNLVERDLASYERGSRCLLHHRGASLAGYTWVSYAPMVELRWGIHFNLPDDMAYNFNSFTLPAFRGNSCQAQRHLALMQAIQTDKKHRLFGYIDHLNYRSLRGTRKSGYQIIGTLAGIKKGKSIKFNLEVKDHAWSQQVRIGPQQN